ncbi:hypothetical protein ACFU6I_22735 [Streptomyces sp. NPDC057486]|uniref:hypothetical protein n=1 Tax=Streptomyces sp. NPDC057486 TaxID=3346145 RepID=UPI0036C000A2
MKERRLSQTTDELYRRLLRLRILPAFDDLDLDQITAPRVRSWRSERLDAPGAETTVAKSNRLLKAILETAAEDELIRRNPVSHPGWRGKVTATERDESPRRSPRTGRHSQTAPPPTRSLSAQAGGML